jgi:hypothetical protein
MTQGCETVILSANDTDRIAWLINSNRSKLQEFVGKSDFRTAFRSRLRFVFCIFKRNPVSFGTVILNRVQVVTELEYIYKLYEMGQLCSIHAEMREAYMYLVENHEGKIPP